MRKITRERLRRTASGRIKLKNNQTISQEEYKKFVSRVNQVNAKRKKMIADLPKVAQQSYFFNKEKGGNFIPYKKSKSINRFRNKAEFNEYMKGLDRILHGTRSKEKSIIRSDPYEKWKLGQYRRNLNKALDKVFNSSAKPLKQFVKSLSDKELKELTLNGAFEDIGYIYDEPISTMGKLEELTRQIEQIRKHK